MQLQWELFHLASEEIKEQRDLLQATASIVVRAPLIVCFPLCDL